MIKTLKDKMVGKRCTVELTSTDDGYQVRGYYGDCFNYNFECFNTYEEAETFYNSLNTVRKCKQFYTEVIQ